MHLTVKPFMGLRHDGSEPDAATDRKRKRHDCPQRVLHVKGYSSQRQLKAPLSAGLEEGLMCVRILNKPTYPLQIGVS
jgi:hypothetical protein